MTEVEGKPMEVAAIAGGREWFTLRLSLSLDLSMLLWHEKAGA